VGRKKKSVTNITITGIADKGKSIGRDESGQVYFVDGAVPGDVVDVLVLRKKKSYNEAIVTRQVSMSDLRTTPICEHFKVCGGCKWQHMLYSAQLTHKEQIVKDCMRRIGKLDESIVHPILGCASPFEYRNKLEYSFSNKRWITREEAASDTEIINEGALGFHRPGSFDKIVDIHKCHLQADLTNDIRNFVRDYARERALSFYDTRNHSGFLRNMILRNNLAGEWMLVVVFGYQDDEMIPQMMGALKERFSQITSLNYTVNTKVNDTIYDQTIITYHGESYLVESLGNVKYKIGTKSFFQTNTTQAINLFDVAVSMADLQKTDNVYDLYTGLGSIALYISDKVKHVTGIEEIPEAIHDANENMAFNNITNATFYAGDVKDILNDTFVERHGRPDKIITDPPRAGMHPEVIETLLAVEAKQIVYISCNPSTQARDLQLLSEKYIVTAIQPVDMFPHTSHIECVANLVLKA
jgi:23S rRNA (uracil1939-C5)-methyltransferase